MKVDGNGKRKEMAIPFYNTLRIFNLNNLIVFETAIFMNKLNTKSCELVLRTKFLLVKVKCWLLLPEDAVIMTSFFLFKNLKKLLVQESKN